MRGLQYTISRTHLVSCESGRYRRRASSNSGSEGRVLRSSLCCSAVPLSAWRPDDQRGILPGSTMRLVSGIVGAKNEVLASRELAAHREARVHQLTLKNARRPISRLSFMRSIPEGSSIVIAVRRALSHISLITVARILSCFDGTFEPTRRAVS